MKISRIDIYANINHSMIIYKAINTVNNKVYIGQTIFTLEYRKRQHLNNVKRLNTKFHNAIAKYGAESFEWTVLEDDIKSIEHLNIAEIKYIEEYNSFNTGYNMNKGGDGVIGFTHTENTRQKMREAAANRTMPKWTEERKLNASKARKGRKLPSLSNDHKRKISDAKKGKPLSEEHILKLTGSHKGKLSGPENTKCPHCGKDGKSNAMYRWHFDNCKKNENKSN